MIDLVTRQSAQLIWVGDPYQQIYSWRGAHNALDRVGGHRLPLSHSWRFGSEIAEWANRILVDLFHSRPPLTGHGPAATVLSDPREDGSWDTVPPGTAILCRSNAGVVSQALAHLDQHRRVAVTGGVKALSDLLRGAWNLYEGQPSFHPELAPFDSWDDLVAIAQTPLGNNFAPIVKLVKTYQHQVVGVCRRLESQIVPETSADVVISTAHKAKGREWPRVALAGDFPAFASRGDDGPVQIHDEEARLWYVAMTRAIHQLDLTAVKSTWDDSFRTIRGG